MKIYDDDNEVLAMARKDGVRHLLTEAMQQTKARVFLVGLRAYWSHPDPRDSGYSCVEAEDLPELLDVIGKISRILGPMSDFRLHRIENTCQGARH